MAWCLEYLDGITSLNVYGNGSNGISWTSKVCFTKCFRALFDFCLLNLKCSTHLMTDRIKTINTERLCLNERFYVTKYSNIFSL
jgi:hypothetical protein